MTAIETLISQLKVARKKAIDSNLTIDRALFANLALGAWPTILHALEELDRRRVS